MDNIEYQIQSFFQEAIRRKMNGDPRHIKEITEEMMAEDYEVKPLN